MKRSRNRVELLGVDREDREAALEQHLDDRTVRRLDRHADARRRRGGLGDEPIAELAQFCAAMGDLALLDRPPVPIQQADERWEPLAQSNPRQTIRSPLYPLS